MSARRRRPRPVAAEPAAATPTPTLDDFSTYIGDLGKHAPTDEHSLTLRAILYLRSTGARGPRLYDDAARLAIDYARRTRR